MRDGLPPRGASRLTGLAAVVPGRRDAGVGVPGDPRREDAAPGEERAWRTLRISVMYKDKEER